MAGAVDSRRRVDKRPRDARILFSAAAALLLALTSTLCASALFASGTSIDFSAPVTSKQCNPCHVRIAESRTEGLLFGHGTHILVDCGACHPRMPHGPDGTERPSMEACFACHGLEHGAEDMSVANAACDVCHTPAFDTRPADHVPDWVPGRHSEAGRTEGTNRCMMCHAPPLDCEPCHTEMLVDVRVFPVYVPLVSVPEPRPPVTIDLDAPVTAGQCLFCHNDIDVNSRGRIVFEHDVHIVRDYSCASCHPIFPHTRAGASYNTMADCYRCHSLEHSAQGLVATEECLACHPPSFDLKPLGHTAAFEAADHGGAVAEDETYCTLCHKGPFCQECHRAGRPMADGSPPRYVVPADHTEAVWLSRHGTQFLERTGTCWACHDSPSCERCHHTPMPHPGEWLRTHARYEVPVDRESDCSVCHKDRQWCQGCHHESVRQVDLVAENCVPCHEEMAEKPATSIRHKAFAEHAVHFDVEESKGRPYRCYECHATWAARNGHIGSPGDIGHDLRLCYDCHGALDYQSVIIAPWPGAQLCGRCHEQAPTAGSVPPNGPRP